ncbi:MAG: hypothetical protein KKD35_04860 [Elusimicrobia bacterium]|nr:hypothetical protein [Elusimicrobiota bacterium]
MPNHNKDLQNPLKHEIAKSSFIVTVFTILGLGLSFLSSIIIAAKFGAGEHMDVFWASTTLPLFIITILSGSLNFTFIPVFAEYRTKNSPETWQVVSSFINLNIIVSIALCIIGVLTAYPLMSVITPGFSHEKLLKASELLRWLFPIIVFTLINELLASVYYSNRRFIIPSLNKIISPGITIIYVLLFHNSLSTKSIVLAMLTASFIQMFLLVIGFLKKKEFNYSLTLNFAHPGVLKILKLMTPLVLGMTLYSAVPLVDRFILSTLTTGSISHIGYAMKLLSAITPVIASGIAISVFPIMSTYAAEKNWVEFKKIINKSVRMLFFMSIPFVVLFGLYGKPIIQLFFERGAFKSIDTIAVYSAFAIYLISLPAIVIGSIISQSFYALQETKIIALIGVLMIILYIILCVSLVGSLSYLAIPISYAIYSNCTILTTTIVLKNKIKKLWPPLMLFLGKSSITALLSAGIVYPLMKFTSNNILTTPIVCALGFFLYFIIGKFLFSLEEPDLILQLLKNKIFKRANS